MLCQFPEPELYYGSQGRDEGFLITMSNKCIFITAAQPLRLQWNINTERNE